MWSQNVIVHASAIKYISSLARNLACIQIISGLKFSLGTRSDRHLIRDSSLLGCDTLLLCEWFLMFWTVTVPSSSRSSSVAVFLDCFTLQTKALWSFETSGKREGDRWLYGRQIKQLVNKYRKREWKVRTWKKLPSAEGIRTSAKK